MQRGKGYTVISKNKIPRNRFKQRGKGGFIGCWFLLQVRWELLKAFEQRSNIQGLFGKYVESRLRPEGSGRWESKGKSQEASGVATVLILQLPLLCPSYLPSNLDIRTPGLSSISH